MKLAACGKDMIDVIICDAFAFPSTLVAIAASSELTGGEKVNQAMYSGIVEAWSHVECRNIDVNGGRTNLLSS